MKTFKSILAVVFGMIVGAGLSIGTDSALHLGSLKGLSVLFILGIVAYRFVYNAIGCFVVARLAPGNAKKLVKIVAWIGFVLGLLGTLATMNMDVGPLWYGLLVALISFPSASLGLKISGK